MIVDRNYRGCRIEVKAELANGLWDARVRIFRAPSGLVHVETIICQQPTAAIAEEGSVIRARRWVDGQSGRSLKTVRVAFAVATLCGLIAFALAVAVLIQGDSPARASLTLAFSLVLLRAAVGVGRGDWRAAWLTVTLGVVAVAVLFTTRPATLLLALALLVTSFVAAVRLHARRRTPSGHERPTRAPTRIESIGGALLAWWGWARVMIGAAFPPPLVVGIAVALGVAWLIGLSIAAFGAVGTVGLVVWLGLGMALTVLPLVLIGRFIMWLRRKRKERHP